MKKKLMIVAAGLLAMMGMTANAQTTQYSVNPTPETPQNKMYQPREFTELAFEGILLDIDQQTRMDSLNAAVKAQCPVAQARPDGQCKKGDVQCKKGDGQCKKGDGQCKKGDGQCKKGDGQCKKGDGQCKKGDGQCKKGDGQCKKGDGPRRELRPQSISSCPYGEEYIQKVKEILTPDQYVMFLENIVNMPQRPMMSPQGSGHGRGHGHQPMMRGAACGNDKPADCGSCPAPQAK